jgi:type II secretory ATPase GspE/PulE/Tfp pilus assembly ATPase PilB-like protein
MAVKQGMLPIIEDGLLKALDGRTTVDEVLRVSKE